MLATIFFLISVFVIVYCTWTFSITTINLIAHAIAKQSFKFNLNNQLVVYCCAVTYAVWYLVVL